MRGKIVAALTIAAACTLSCTATAAPVHGGGTVHLLDYTDNDAATTTVVLTGAIGDLGQGVSVNPDGSLSTEHSELNLVLSQGSFRLDIAALDKKFANAAGTVPFQYGPKSCSGFSTVTDAAPIVAGSGTGAYLGVGGTFQLTMTLNEVDAPISDNRCDVTGALIGQIIVTEGTAQLSYSS